MLKVNRVNEQVKQLVQEINRIHREFSESCFDTGLIERVKLSRTITNVPVAHIYKYRLVLHESINDYLMTSDIELKYFYRVKTRESIEDKIARYSQRDNQYPVNNWLNDIFGVRIILSKQEIEEVMEALDDWQDELNLKNWYLRDKEGYRGLHVYFKNRSNVYFPWELQIWDREDLQSNVENHERFKRRFIQ
ncbi:GTP pyrophosphokinase [Vibrio cholerae]